MISDHGIVWASGTPAMFSNSGWFCVHYKLTLLCTAIDLDVYIKLAIDL